MSQNDNLNKGLIPRNDLEEGEFPHTYLNEVPNSRDYNNVNYQDLKNARTSNTTLPDLFHLFQSQAIPGIVTFGETDHIEELYDWYLQLNKMISNKYFPTLEKIHQDNDTVQLLSGYNNTKEYLIRALVRNKFLVLKFINILDNSASNLEIQMSAHEVVRLMELEYPSDQDKHMINQFLHSFMEGFYNQDLYNEIAAYVEVTLDLSNRVRKILENHSQQIIR